MGHRQLRREQPYDIALDLCRRVALIFRFGKAIVDIRGSMLRQATVTDVAGIQRVRRSVRENRLVSTRISDGDVRRAIERTGRGWVVESDGEVVAFAIANATNGNIWALFVHPDHERRGHGRALHDTMVDWLRAQGLERLWLTTEPGTRAQSFYESAGWRLVGSTNRGELRYERDSQADGRPQESGSR